jgi:hypothetical protein
VPTKNPVGIIDCFEKKWSEKEKGEKEKNE